MVKTSVNSQCLEFLMETNSFINEESVTLFVLFAGHLFILLWLNLLRQWIVTVSILVSPGSGGGFTVEDYDIYWKQNAWHSTVGMERKVAMCFVCQEWTPSVNIPQGVTTGLKPEQGCHIKGFLSLYISQGCTLSSQAAGTHIPSPHNLCGTVWKIWQRIKQMNLR